MAANAAGAPSSQKTALTSLALSRLVDSGCDDTELGRLEPRACFQKEYKFPHAPPPAPPGLPDFMQKPSLLIVDRDPHIGPMLVTALSRDFDVETATTVDDALAASRYPTHAGFVVDVDSGCEDGLRFVDSVRTSGDERTIVALSGVFRRDLPARCYEAGVDGCVAKTGLLVRELRAMLNRFIKRSPVTRQSPRTDGVLLPKREFRFAGGVVSAELMSVRFSRSHAIELSPKEVGILDCFARGQGRLVRRSEILEHVWGPKARPTSRSLDTYLTRLRQVYRKGGIDLKRIVRSKSKVGWWVAAK